MNKTKFGSLLLLLQGILLILFVTFVDYGDDFKPSTDGDKKKEENFNSKLPGIEAKTLFSTRADLGKWSESDTLHEPHL